jgi:hypothetical protein
MIGSEIILLRMLNSAPVDDDIVDQREVVAGVISALRGCLEQLPMPARFNYLDAAVRHADADNGVSPTKEAIMQANADLARKLCAAHAPAQGRDEWETALVHATAAHREMASAVRWKRSPQ